MNNFLKFSGSIKLLKITSIITLLVYVFLIIITSYTAGFEVGSNDNYKNLFLSFIESGYYDSVVEGTSILYNLILSGFYSIAGNVDMSFLIFNSINQLFLIVFGYYFLKKIHPKTTIYFIIIVGLYALFILNQKYFINVYNDTFLGVLIVVLMYFLIKKLFDEKESTTTFIFIGILFALCISVRLTAVYLVPLIFVAYMFWFNQSIENKQRKAFKISISIVTAVLVISMFHYPSIIENQALSFNNKNPEDTNLNWTKRNYLGLKKIENGEEKMHRDAIWKNTRFEEVSKYLEVNGDNSLPKNYFEVLKQDPILVIKVFTYNVVYSLLRFFRFWGLLFFIIIAPFLSFKKIKDIFKNQHVLPSSLFLIYMLILSFTCLTFIEFRWFFGYELLIPLAILVQLDEISVFKNIYKKNMIFSLSLIIITMFNCRTIFNLLDRI